MERVSRASLKKTAPAPAQPARTEAPGGTTVLVGSFPCPLHYQTEEKDLDAYGRIGLRRYYAGSQSVCFVQVYVKGKFRAHMNNQVGHNGIELQGEIALHEFIVTALQGKPR